MGRTVRLYALQIAMGHVDIPMDHVKTVKKIGKAIAPKVIKITNKRVHFVLIYLYECNCMSSCRYM